MPLRFPKPFLPWPTSAVGARDRGASKLPLDPHGHRMPMERTKACAALDPALAVSFQGFGLIHTLVCPLDLG